MPRRECLRAGVNADEKQIWCEGLLGMRQQQELSTPGAQWMQMDLVA